MYLQIFKVKYGFIFSPDVQVWERCKIALLFESYVLIYQYNAPRPRIKRTLMYLSQCVSKLHKTFTL